MSDLRTAAQQAMDILDSEFTTVNGEFCRWCDGRLSAKHNCKLEQVITALRAALAEPVQEPVAWALHTGTKQGIKWGRRVEHGTPLYTAPPMRKPLTEEEILTCFDESVEGYVDIMDAEVIDFARAIEQEHGIGGGNE